MILKQDVPHKRFKSVFNVLNDISPNITRNLKNSYEFGPEMFQDIVSYSFKVFHFYPAFVLKITHPILLLHANIYLYFHS